MTRRYTVQILRSGQPRPYADTETEILISVETLQRYNDPALYPGFPGGNLDDIIAREEGMRAKGRMYGGMSPEDHRKERRAYALRVLRALGRNFREPGDDDGRTGMDAHFYPTLKKLEIDEAAGTIRALIIDPFTD